MKSAINFSARQMLLLILFVLLSGSSAKSQTQQNSVSISTLEPGLTSSSITVISKPIWDPDFVHPQCSIISANGRFIAYLGFGVVPIPPEDRILYTDLHIYDRETQVTRLVPNPLGGSENTYADSCPSISASGQFIVFVPWQINYGSPPDPPEQLYLYDQIANTFELISVSVTGEPGNGNSQRGIISGDGRFVIFQSWASNLVPNDSGESLDNFIWDRQTKQTLRIDLPLTPGSFGFSVESISSDGRFLVYSPGNSLFLYDRQTNQSTQIEERSFESGGEISADGRYIAYTLFPSFNTYVYDRLTGQKQTVSVSSSGDTANNESSHPQISRDGRFIVFNSNATNLVEGKGRGLYVHDLVTKNTWYVDGESSERYGYPPYHYSISADGQTVAIVFVGEDPTPIEGERVLLYVANITEENCDENNPSINAIYVDRVSDDKTNNQECVGKLPIIFIPGMMGSNLRPPGDSEDVWPGGLLTDHRSLSLRPGEEKLLITTDAIRQFIVADKVVNHTVIIYEPLLHMLQEAEYVEYNLKGNPIYRTTSGCDISQKDRKPTLFVFPYDWRISNAENAVKLKDYIGCIHRIYEDSYPGTKINIIAHSMGGLLARRYILDAIRAGEPHYIEKQITIGTPWLGAAKAINMLETGKDDFGLNLIIFPNTLRMLAAYFPGVHQLLPSGKYFQQVGIAFKEEGCDINRNGDNFEEYDYVTWTKFANRHYPKDHTCESPSLCQPGTNNQEFHEFTGQDSWQAVPTGVDYHYIVGIQSKAATIESVSVISKPNCYPTDAGDVCTVMREIKLNFGLGDETVPLASARRGMITSGIDGDSIKLHSFESRSGKNDDTVQHTKLTHNVSVHNLILRILRGEIEANAAKIGDILISPEPAYYVTVSGGKLITVINPEGKITKILSDTFQIRDAAEIAYYTTSESSFTTVIPSLGTYTLTFNSGTTPMSVEIRKGIGTVTNEAIRYQDVVVPADSPVRLILNGAEVQPLHYDNTDDGFPETPISATVILSGSAAADVEAPLVSIISTTVGSMIRVRIEAQDASGVAKVYYSLDGTNYQTYATDIDINPQLTRTVFAFADDNAANRSSVVRLDLQTTSSFSVYLPLVKK